MGRPRKKENQGLPPYVDIEKGKRRKNGTWPKPYFVLRIKGKEPVKLGHTKAEMYRNYGKIIDRPTEISTMGDLIEAYIKSVSVKKGESTYNNELIKAKFLIAFFKEFEPSEVSTADIYEYMDLRSIKRRVESKINGKKHVTMKGGHVAANRDLAMLSSIFSFAIRKGLINDNPCKDVEKYSESGRDRYIENHELHAVYRQRPPTLAILRYILAFAYLTGQRIGDILKIEKSDMDERGITIIESKSISSIKSRKPKKKLILWTPILARCVNRVLRLRTHVESKFLFCKDDGDRYTYAGIRSIFNRAIQKAIESGKLNEKFNIHDIRAKTYSDEVDKIKSAQRAGHTSPKMGVRYNRKAIEIFPLK
jgi:integrase